MRWSIGKGCLVKSDMARDDDAASGEIKTSVSFVSRWVPEKDTLGGSRGEFVSSSRRCVSVAEAAKDAKVIIGWRCTEQDLVWCFIGECCRGSDVDEVGGSV